MTVPTNAVAALRRHPLPAGAATGGVAGLLAAIGALPPGARAVLLLAFVAIGPGCALLQYWNRDLPAVAQRALVPVLGLAVVVLVVSGTLLLGHWAPRLVLVGLAAGTVALGAAGLVGRVGAR